MGPRSFDRGKVQFDAALVVPVLLQWGRDLSIAERPPDAWTLQLKSDASMGPRSFDRGKFAPFGHADGSFWLQWGRDLSIAERASGPVPCYTSSMLQWGRDLSIAERMTLRHGVELDNLLQWGRDLSIAERFVALLGRALGSRFNGAAIFRSRKGRELVKQAIDTLASMGPRSFDRGKDTMTRPMPRRARCFNGAAIFRSRKARLAPPGAR